MEISLGMFPPPWQVPCSSWLGFFLGLRSPFHMDQVEALINLAVILSW
jgi:hypothetical protein